MEKARRNNNLQPLGFHGDCYLLKVISVAIGDCTTFIETGTNVASITNYVARTYQKQSLNLEELLDVGFKKNEVA